jgi:hypothetical protein
MNSEIINLFNKMSESHTYFINENPSLQFKTLHFSPSFKSIEIIEENKCYVSIWSNNLEYIRVECQKYPIHAEGNPSLINPEIISLIEKIILDTKNLIDTHGLNVNKIVDTILEYSSSNDINQDTKNTMQAYSNSIIKHSTIIPYWVI